MGVYLGGMKLPQWAKANGLAYQNGLAHVALRQTAYSFRTTPDWNGHRPSAQSPDCRIGCALCAGIKRGSESRSRVAAWGFVPRASDGHPLSLGDSAIGHRAKIMRLLSDPSVQSIVVEHRDRLARFGSEDIEAARAAYGRKRVVVDETEIKDDLVEDMVDVLRSFCARPYGRPAAKKPAAKALAAAQAAA